MEHYVTLFDSVFVPQGLALHESLESHAGDYTLWILCMDDEVHSVLTCLNLPNIELLKLCEVETQELLLIKNSRTRAEYCWTLTPFTFRFVFNKNSKIERVTYLDADVWFMDSPKLIFDELDKSNKPVLITEHAYAPEHDQSASSGRYCVQFITFKRNEGEEVRQWWEDRCIEWCFNRCEDGKFGDQKYLDDWPQRFPNKVHVLQRQEWMLAPWNVTRFSYSQAIMYHFHGLRLMNKGKVKLTDYIVPPVVIANVYVPYLKKINNIYKTLRLVDFAPKQQEIYPGFLLRAIRTIRTIRGVFLLRWRFFPPRFMDL